MADFSNLEEVSRIDSANLRTTLFELPEQLAAAWKAVRAVTLPAPYVRVRQIVFLGMGGSAIGADLFANLYEDNLKTPLSIVRDYDLPPYVNRESLVIATSYSGGTEETLTAFEEARRRRAKLVAITTGGRLGKLAQAAKVPLFRFNYPTQPRQAFGWLFGAILGIANKVTVINLADETVEEVVLLLKGQRKKLVPESPEGQNRAKQLARRVARAAVQIIASPKLRAVGFRFKTQLNENAKQFAVSEVMPEVCHNTILGYRKPDGFSERLLGILLPSQFDHERVSRRFEIYAELLRARQIDFECIGLEPAAGRLAEALSLLFLLDATSFYTAIANDVDPTPIPEIETLKERLGPLPWQE